ncbi:MAG TPA: helix-turn-helix domain-containing protein [Solirubrobacteraceae bacterium]|jgi:tetratricopeptide (TPR) repeat protein
MTFPFDAVPPVVHHRAVGRSEGASAETIGERIKRLRRERGLSQRALSEPGVSYAYISRIEAGTRQPSVKALRKIGAKLGVSADYLETGSELDPAGARELRLADAELAMRLGDAKAAEESLQELYKDATRAADRNITARAAIALALAAYERGDHAAAVSGLENAFQLDRPSPLERVEVFVTLGRAYNALGQTQREIALYEECLEEIEQLDGDHGSEQARYRILLSYALSDAGQFSRAEGVLRETLAQTDTTDDPLMRIRLFWSLARLSEMKGQSTAALRYARRAITLLEATEDDLHRARAHLLAAWIMNSARDPDGAREQLTRAERLFGTAASADDLAILYVEQARSHSLLDEGAQTVEMAERAIALLDNQDSATVGTAHWALGEGHALQGEIDPASAAFERGVGLLERNRRWREATEAARAWARVLREAGRAEEALDVLDRSAEFALRLAPAQRVQ